MAGQVPAREGPSTKFWVGVVVAVLAVVFVALNREEANVSLLFGEVTMPLWVALTIAAVLGFVAGWLIGRRRK